MYLQGRHALRRDNGRHMKGNFLLLLALGMALLIVILALILAYLN
jgi:hypothetical protein